MAQLNPLRPITQRLNSTPVEELSRCAGFLAASILNCRNTLFLSKDLKTDTSVQLEKLITRISSLLQDRTQEGRYTGIILAKAVVETVGLQSLGNSASSWIRNLLSCLSKPDTPEVKKLAIIAITRIFILTRDNPALTREITSPTLPAYMTACLNNIKPITVSKDGVEHAVLSSLLQPVMQCWLDLIKSFPSTLRPFASSIRAIVLSLTGSSTTPQKVKEVAMQVYATLHFCAPKNSSANDWSQSVQLVIEAVHQTADVLLRSVQEDWSPVTPRQALPSQPKLSAQKLHVPDVDAIGMEKWVGMQSGFARAVDLIDLLRALLTSQQLGAVEFPLAQVVDVAARFAAVLWPTKTYTLRDNKEIGRDEREELFANLPPVHRAILELYSCVAAVFGRAITPISRQVLSQIWDIFGSESQDVRVRLSVYTTITSLLQHGAISLQAQDSEQLAVLVQRCCNDLKPTDVQHHMAVDKLINTTNGVSKTTPTQSPGHKSVKSQSALTRAAWDLLPVLITEVPAILMTSSMRAELDRTAILTGHTEALLASVLNPPGLPNNAQQAPSVLPFLSRSVNMDLGYEALVRPRMPILSSLNAPQQLDKIGETDEASAQKSSFNVQDATPDTVLDDVAREVEDKPIVSNVSELLSIKKREHAEVDDTILETKEESSKRFKSDPNFEPVAPAKIISNTPSESITTTTTVLGNNSGNDIAQQTAGTSDAETEGQSTVPTVIEAVNRDAIHPNIGQDDESDDSEIPQIDATLSSDEDEDDLDDIND